MRKLLTLALLGVFAAVASPAFAAENARQDRMKACNAEAGDKKGDERSKFMSDCLAKKKILQQEKMKVCNTKAGEMKGDDRKKFMSECLKG
ncbi:MAG: PsiF family protein [Betaproteobacteria bacterium]